MRGQSILAILLSSAVTLCIYGYQYGRGNDAAYLVDPLRRANPALLNNDWFATQTLQYHVAFSRMTERLMRLHIVEPAFFVIYILLIVLFHLAWWNIVRSVGGGDAAYLVSVVFYYLCAAGTGLGMYQFFQDSSLLASNIANVAMLWAIAHWLNRSHFRAGVCLGIAGAFHLNHAIVGVALWITLAWPIALWLTRFDRIYGTLAAMLPSLLNIAFAAHLKLTRSGAMPLNEFVDLYVRLRHPHHYDPSTWPIGIWIAFALPMISGLILLRGQARRINLFFLALIFVALIGAGIWYTSETLIQLSLYRFSIYAQLLGCAAAGAWMVKMLNRKREAFAIGAIACAAMIICCAIRGPYFGFFTIPHDQADYVALCRWIRDNTPLDAVFLVPPNEESMHLIGQRAIVVDFKCVPQLSSELVQWQQRLCDVLNLTTLNDLPHGYIQTLQALSERYDHLASSELLGTARKYQADYVVSTHPLPGCDDLRIKTAASGRYLLYHVPL